MSFSQELSAAYDNIPVAIIWNTEGTPLGLFFLRIKVKQSSNFVTLWGWRIVARKLLDKLLRITIWSFIAEEKITAFQTAWKAVNQVLGYCIFRVWSLRLAETVLVIWTFKSVNTYIVTEPNSWFDSLVNPSLSASWFWWSLDNIFSWISPNRSTPYVISLGQPRDALFYVTYFRFFLAFWQRL